MMMTVRPRTIAHILLDNPLAVVVERQRSLIQDADAWIGGEGSGDGDALALAAGEVGPTLLGVNSRAGG